MLFDHCFPLPKKGPWPSLPLGEGEKQAWGHHALTRQQCSAQLTAMGMGRVDGRRQGTIRDLHEMGLVERQKGLKAFLRGRNTDAEATKSSACGCQRHWAAPGTPTCSTVRGWGLRAGGGRVAVLCRGHLRATLKC